MIVQVPTETIVSVVPDTVHTDVVDDVIVTARVEVADADKETVEPEYVWLPGEVNEIVWVALLTVTVIEMVFVA